jgi:hydroxymethylglutaryl-CoA lyase
MNWPGTVHITEVGPRDGLQMEKRVVPTENKVALIEGLADAGLRSIQVAAFVHPVKMPQMADAEVLLGRLSHKQGVQYNALALNVKGVERACRTSVPWIEISLSASDAHGRRNAGLSVPQAIREAKAMALAVARAGRRLRASIQCAFGHLHPLDVEVAQVVRIARFLVDQGVELLLLADTAGMATPPAIQEILAAVAPAVGTVPVGLHLHDTRGFGQSNVRTALELGITHFDTSLGGLGGCPFIAGARGNIPTEETVRLLDSLGISTGIDPTKVAELKSRLDHFFGLGNTGVFP